MVRFINIHKAGTIHARRAILANRRWNAAWWSTYDAVCRSSRFCGDVDATLEAGWDEYHHRHSNQRRRRAAARQRVIEARRLATWVEAHTVVCGVDAVRQISGITFCTGCCKVA